MKVILVELVEIISVTKMSKNGLGIRFVRCVDWVGMCGAVALVECEIEVLSGSFAPWILEKMKIHPYIKICRNCAKRRVYNILYILYAFVLSV